jgi:D-alanine-D-alanine ligase
MTRRITWDATAQIEAETETLRRWARSLAHLKVAVIYGGLSAEDRLYIAKSPTEQLSITAIADSLLRLGVHFKILDPCDPDFIHSLSTYDVALSNLHGPYGEDGRLQGLMDYLKIAYCGSGVSASAVAADKIRCKWAMNSLGIPTPAHLVWRSGDEVVWPGHAVMVKPSLGGSSVGMSLVHDDRDLPIALADAWETDPSAILIEEYIPGTPVTIGLIELSSGVLAFPPFALNHSGEWVDADDKLDVHGSTGPTVTRAELPISVTEVLIDHSHALWNGLGCQGMARVDFMVTDDREVFALEVNTTPGMSVQSNFMISAASCGLNYDDVVRAILHEALLREPYDVPLPEPLFRA